MNALQDYRKLFAPVIPAVTDTEPIYAAYERMRQADVPQHTILLLVECQTMEEFREALGRLPMRKSSEWRSFDNTDFWERYFRGINDSEVSDLN
jgi:DNA repair photolyase